MEILGILTYTTDGKEYICWWSPSDETFAGSHAVILARVAAMMIQDPADFKVWQTEVQNRYEKLCQSLFGQDTQVEMEVVKGSNTH